MKKNIYFCLFAMAVLVAGCKTTESETKRISWEEQRAYLRKLQDPRLFGLSIYDTPAGPEIRGGGRLHRSRTEAIEMLAEKPLRPLVYLTGNSDEEWPALLDFTSPATWLGFDLARQLNAQPIGELNAQLVTRPGDEIPACMSTVSSLRMGQMFIEHPLVFVRMATGSLGALNRNVSDGPVKAVIGWDILKKFDRIQFLYSMNRIVLMTTTEEYEPNPERLAATLPLVSPLGLCAVEGRMNGQSGPVLIDPAGDFQVAAPGTVSSLQLGEGISLSSPVTVPSPDGVRIGARFLQNYQVTVCPQAGVIHFEKPVALRGK